MIIQTSCAVSKDLERLTCHRSTTGFRDCVKKQAVQHSEKQSIQPVGFCRMEDYLNKCKGPVRLARNSPANQIFHWCFVRGPSNFAIRPSAPTAQPLLPACAKLRL